MVNGPLSMECSQGQFEYNPLKRKLDVEDNNSPSQVQQINNNIENSKSNSGNNWKRRHLEDSNNCFNNSTNQQYHSNSSCDENHSHSSNCDLSFNLIGSSSFINDLFAYDSNLIVPIPASLVNSNSSLCCSSSNLASYSTASSTTANSSFEEVGVWQQSTDLLELDHRYNSGLQTEITQLNATVGVKTNSNQNVQDTQMDFLVPGKPVTKTSSTAIANSSQQNVTSTENDADFEDKNLSWLLNFRFDEFPHLSPDVGANNQRQSQQMSQQQQQPNSTVINTQSTGMAVKSLANSSSSPNSNERSPRSPKTIQKTGKKFEELVMEVTSEIDGNEIQVAENVIVEDSFSPAKT